MKLNILLGIFLGILMLGVSAEATTPEINTEGLYPQTFIVIEATDPDPEGIQTVTIETVTGFLYQFESDAGDWMAGDLCACIMDRNGTPEIYDDAVVDANYSGIAEWFVEIYTNS